MTAFHTDPRTIARALGGDVVGRDQVVAPGPGHSPRDRSLSIRLSAISLDGFLVFSHAADDWRACRDHVLDRLRLPRDGWKRERPRAPAPRQEDDNRDLALYLWRRRQPMQGSLAERYLREARGYSGFLPSTFGFLPATGEHPPSMIAAFGLTNEPECGVLGIADADVRAVHLTRLAADGLSRIDKIMIGRGASGFPIWCAPVNDGLGLAVTEGIEDALSVHEATGLGAWAAGSAPRMPALADTVPNYVACVTIIGDDNDAGRKNAGELAARLKARCIPVILKVIGGGLVEAA